MAVLTFAQIEQIALDRAAANVSTDGPFGATGSAETTRIINDALADVYSISEGRILRVASATAWSAAQTSTSGILTGILTDVEDVQAVFASTTSGSTGITAGDKELDPVELGRIKFLRNADGGMPTYSVPKVYAVHRPATSTPGSVNLLELHFWPAVANFYVPLWYVRQCVAIDSATVTTPDVNDLESRDVALLAGARMAQLNDRFDLVPGILADLSQRTALSLERKIKAMLHGKQDRRTEAA